MGFTFGFTEDLDSDNELNASNIDQPSTSSPFVNPIDSFELNYNRPPLFHDLTRFKSELVGTRITYEPVEVLNNEFVYKRELYDVKHQLMLEDGDSSVNEQEQLLQKQQGNGEEEFKILIGETEEDLKNGVYEGGLKSWECSFDMIIKLKELEEQLQFDLVNDESQPFDIIELGCGTSLPSLFLFKKVLINIMNGHSKKQIKFILTDYNYEVLRLVTLPNLLSTWCETVLSKGQLFDLQKRDDQEGNVREGELDVSINLMDEFISWLDSNNVSFGFISGSWNREFMNILNGFINIAPRSRNLVLTSETIYSPLTINLISEMLVELALQDSTVILTAKDIYFGVGGSITEFIGFLECRQDAGIEWSVDKVSAGLQRSVVLLKRSTSH